MNNQPVFEDIPTHIEGIVFDAVSHEYYNNKTDIYLSDDDITFYKLRPYDQITTPLPKPLPEKYWEAPNN